MSTLVGERDLERLLAEAAASFPVPAGGPAGVLGAAAEGPGGEQVTTLDRHRDRHRARRPLLAVAAALVVLVGIGLGAAQLGGGTGSTGSSGSATSGLTSPQLAVGAVAAASAAGKAQGLRDLAGAPVAAGGVAALPAPAGATVGAAGTATKGFTDSTTGTATGTTRAGGAAGGAAARVVQTGTVALTVAPGAVPATVARLEGAATGLGGFLAGSTSTETGAAPGGTVTLRVPSDRFPALLTTVRGLGTVATQTTVGRDVTADYADLGSRLTALKATRSTYLSILTTARTVQETLSVQQRLDDVQQQIEQLQGQQKVLADQSDLATLTVTVAQRQAAAVLPPAPPRERGPWSQALHDAGHTLVATAQGLVAASGGLLLALVALGLCVLGARSWQRSRRRRQLSEPLA